jgi:hypothetical protein
MQAWLADEIRGGSIERTNSLGLYFQKNAAGEILITRLVNGNTWVGALETGLIEPGDVLVKVDGCVVSDIAEIRPRIFNAVDGGDLEYTELTIYRPSACFKFIVRMPRPAPTRSQGSLRYVEWMGVRLQQGSPLGPISFQGFDDAGALRCLFQHSSPDLRIDENDVLLEIDGHDVSEGYSLDSIQILLNSGAAATPKQPMVTIVAKKVKTGLIIAVAVPRLHVTSVASAGGSVSLPPLPPRPVSRTQLTEDTQKEIFDDHPTDIFDSIMQTLGGLKRPRLQRVEANQNKEAKCTPESQACGTNVHMLVDSGENAKTSQEVANALPIHKYHHPRTIKGHLPQKSSNLKDSNRELFKKDTYHDPAHVPLRSARGSHQDQSLESTDDAKPQSVNLIQSMQSTDALDCAYVCTLPSSCPPGIDIPRSGEEIGATYFRISEAGRVSAQYPVPFVSHEWLLAEETAEKADGLDTVSSWSSFLEGEEEEDMLQLERRRMLHRVANHFLSEEPDVTSTLHQMRSSKTLYRF